MVVPATPRGIFVLITALLEHISTKIALGLRFLEVDFFMNAPLLEQPISQNAHSAATRELIEQAKMSYRC
jgi:hypothetical protein